MRWIPGGRSGQLSRGQWRPSRPSAGEFRTYHYFRFYLFIYKTALDESWSTDRIGLGARGGGGGTITLYTICYTVLVVRRLLKLNTLPFFSNRNPWLRELQDSFGYFGSCTYCRRKPKRFCVVWKIYITCCL